MQSTGLNAMQIRHYMHNNARKGRRIVHQMLECVKNECPGMELGASDILIPAPTSKIMKKKMPKLAKKSVIVKKLVREMIIRKRGREAKGKDLSSKK